MIIFSQGPTSHSRMGNSIDWMTKVAYWANCLNLKVFFPWAAERLNNYLPEDSYWIENIKEAKSLFLNEFKIELTSKSISKISRKYEVIFEKENSLDPFNWKSIIFIDKTREILYITGVVDLASDNIIELINQAKLIIIHEPFNMIFLENLSLVGENYETVLPCTKLYQTQLEYVRINSFNQRTVGFHIRRGDYSTWQKGAYYYSNSFWVENAKYFIKNSCSVWIFSNELSDELRFQLEKIGVFFSNGDYAIDFVRMMFMDTIYGPPSTYSRKATNISAKIFNTKSNIFLLPKILS